MTGAGSPEDRLIARHFAPLARHPGALGLRDDAAMFTPPPGCDLVLTTDGIIADKLTRFCFPELRLGLIPGYGGIPRLKRDMGNAVTRDLLLTGRIFGAEEALKLGLVNEIIAPEKLMARAQELAAQLLENSPASLQATKKLLSSYTREQLDRQVKQAIHSNAAIRQTTDFKEGVTAFLEKRKPTWTGK